MRIERDTLGEVRVPDDALYGAQTQRAVENYPISGLRAHPAFVRAFILLKKAAVLANLANVSLGGKLGEYKPVNPNDHVNMSQSTNDVFPTAMRVAAVDLLGILIPRIEDLRVALRA